MPAGCGCSGSVGLRDHGLPLRELAMKYLASLLLASILGVGTVGLADPPPAPPKPVEQPRENLSISGDMAIPPWGMATLTVSGASAGTTAWLVLPAPVSESDVGNTMSFAGPPGTYTAIAFAVVGGQPYIIKTRVFFQSPGPAPPAPTPDPPTPPVPPVPPTPKPTGNVWALAIYDSANQVNLPEGQLAIYGSPTIQSAAKAAGAIWRRFDILDSVPSAGGGLTPLGSTKWGQAATKVGLPALVMLDSTGKILTATPLPANENSAITAIKTVVGGATP